MHPPSALLNCHTHSHVHSCRLSFQYSSCSKRKPYCVELQPIQLLQHVQALDHVRKKSSLYYQVKRNYRTTVSSVKQVWEPNPENYCMLSIIPSLSDIPHIHHDNLALHGMHNQPRTIVHRAIHHGKYFTFDQL